MDKKVLFGAMFVILAFAFMFYDALFHIDFISKKSAALTHAAHMESSEEHMDDGHAHEETIAATALPSSITLNYPKKSPDTSVNKLPFKEVGGFKEFQLTVDEIQWEYGENKYVHAWAYNGQVPGPEIRVNLNDKVRVIVKNNLRVPTTVHWHGLDVENKADGVPGFTQYPIMPGETYTYEFTARNSGTKFYHSHGSSHNEGDSVTQMDMGLSGALIIETPKDKVYDQEYIYLLDEWEINQDGSNGALSGLSADGVHEHSLHAGSQAYNVFTINGRVFPDIEPLMVKEGETVLLRLINVGSQEIHPMHTHGHSFKVVAIDGNPVPEMVQQVRDTITVNPGEKYDIEIFADNPGAWMFHCHHLHHAAAGMVVSFLYEGYEPCCLDEESSNGNHNQMVSQQVSRESTGIGSNINAHDDDGHGHNDADDHDSNKISPFSTFGPGESPHVHELDLSDYEQVADIARSSMEVVPPLNRNYSTKVDISLISKEVISEIAPGITFHYWTFDGKVPGPFLRVREGDTIILTLKNDKSSSHNHSIDLHAVTGPGGGAVLTQVEPGGSKTLSFKALNPGLYVYHCATPNVPMHMANGMYGMILVEPKGGLPKVDKEFYVMQGELYTKGSIGEKGFQYFDATKMLYENPEYVIFNGRVKALVDHPLTAKVGDKIRLFVGNGGVSFISSFHVIGEIFDTLYPEASSNSINNVQTTVIPAGGATMAEFQVDYPGSYVLVDHSLARLDKGAWGMIDVEGEPDPEIYSAVK